MPHPLLLNTHSLLFQVARQLDAQKGGRVGLGGAGTSTAKGNPDAGATDLKQQQQQHFRKQK